VEYAIGKFPEGSGKVSYGVGKFLGSSGKVSYGVGKFPGNSGKVSYGILHLPAFCERRTVALESLPKPAAIFPTAYSTNNKHIEKTSLCSLHLCVKKIVDNSKIKFATKK
jgi:hypothetical protein